MRALNVRCPQVFELKVIFVPIGSAGDVHPFVAVALALRQRGHDVSVITSPYFSELFDDLKIPFVPFGTVEQYEAITHHPGLWHPLHGFRVVSEAMGMGTPELFSLVNREIDKGGDIVVSGALAFGARIAQEKTNFPLVTMHLQPTAFWSIKDSPIFHPWLSSINRFPDSVKQLILTLADRVSDRALTRTINPFRKTLGLRPVRHIVSQWWHSPIRTIGLFPSWFAPPQSDWPPNATLTGFPLYDEQNIFRSSAKFGPLLNDIDAENDPPIVFAPGSGNRQAHRFFKAAVDACKKLDRRALLLTRYREQLPSPLPKGVHHVDYIPFSKVLPLAAALVHHGGVGTAAQALAAGCPQLVMPMTFDQPDNAHRLAKLGVARILKPSQFRGKAVASTLSELLASAAVSRQCQTVSRRFEGVNPIETTCELIEAAK